MSLPLSRCAAVVCGVIGLSTAALVTVSPSNADEPAEAAERGSRFTPLPSVVRRLPTLRTILEPVELAEDGLAGNGGTAGTCDPEVVTHTDFSFEGGPLVIQAGFEEDEIAAASFTVPAEHFPLRIDVTEMVFGQQTTVQTETHWSLLIWEGTPGNGTLLYEFSSDGDILPHLIMPPGTNATNVQVQVDPGDPEQLFVSDNGSQTFSVGYRIDQHNSPGTPCLVPPAENANAFPCTDVSGLAAPLDNWLCAVSGPLCICSPGLCSTFQALPGLCTPSGDWLLRVTYTPFECGGGGGEFGACCLPDGICLNLFDDGCEIANGVFQGDGTECDGAECPQPTVPCCFEATQGCLDLDPGDCAAAGGVPSGDGLVCDDIICFPSGACCLIDGSCAGDMSPEDCDATGGIFQGDGVECESVSCPEPVGGCCFDTGFCLELSESECEGVGASWAGIGTNCDDGNNNGSADACESSDPAEDLNGDGLVNGADLGIMLGDWGPCEGCPADLNGDGMVDGADLGQLLGAWTG